MWEEWEDGSMLPDTWARDTEIMLDILEPTAKHL